MVQMLSHVLFHPHSLPTAVQQKESVLLLSVIQQDVHITSYFIHALIHSAGGESDVPLTETVVLPPTVEGDYPVTFTPDILTHRPHHRVTGSGPQKRHAVLQLHPATEKH